MIDFNLTFSLLVLKLVLFKKFILKMYDKTDIRRDKIEYQIIPPRIADIQLR